MNKFKSLDSSKLVEIGFLRKTNGVGGELFLVFNEGFSGKNAFDNFLFLEIEGLPVPYKLESFELRDDQLAVVKLKYIDSKEVAHGYLGCKVYSFIENRRSDDEFNPFALTGYLVYNQKNQEIGTIDGINNYGGNIVLTVLTDNGEVLIPYHNQLLISTDKQSKSIMIDIAQGLFD